jgi:hypothetical protein
MLNPITAPTIGAPSQTAVPQNLQALQLANARRSAVAELKARVRRGELTITEVVLDPPGDLRGYLLFEVLLWAPRVGRDTVRRLNGRALRRCELNLANELGALTDRQRRWLAEQLGGC